MVLAFSAQSAGAVPIAFSFDYDPEDLRIGGTTTDDSVNNPYSFTFDLTTTANQGGTAGGNNQIIGCAGCAFVAGTNEVTAAELTINLGDSINPGSNGSETVVINLDGYIDTVGAISSASLVYDFFTLDLLGSFSDGSLLITLTQTLAGDNPAGGPNGGPAAYSFLSAAMTGFYDLTEYSYQSEIQSEIPEPASIALFGIGLLTLTAIRRRRSRPSVS